MSISRDILRLIERDTADSIVPARSKKLDRINTITDSEFKLVPNVLKKLFGGDWIRVPNDSFSKTVRWRDGSREVTREVSGKGARFYIRGVRDRNAPSRVDFEIEETRPEDVTVNVTKGLVAAEERRRWDNAEHRYRILPKSNTKYWKYDREGKKAGTKEWRRVTANEMIDVSRRVTNEWIKDGFPFYAKLWHPHIVSYVEDTNNDRLNQRPYPIAVIERMMKLVSKDPRNRRTLEQLNSQWIERNRKEHREEVEHIGRRNHRHKYERRVTFVVESASLELKLPCALIYEIPEWETERKETSVRDGSGGKKNVVPRYTIVLRTLPKYIYTRRRKEMDQKLPAGTVRDDAIQLHSKEDWKNHPDEGQPDKKKDRKDTNIVRLMVEKKSEKNLTLGSGT